MKSNAAAITQKWQTAMGGATAAYTAGVQAVTVPPGQKAAAAQATYIARVQEKAPVWAANVAAVPLASWQAAAVNKGAPRLASGALAAAPKFQTFMTALLAFEANAIGSLPPRGSLAQNQQRMIAWSNAMVQFKKPAGS